MPSNRLVFEGIIGRAETEEEIRNSPQGIAQPQIKDWYSGTWQLFNECDIIWQENGGSRRPDRVMMRDGTQLWVVTGSASPTRNITNRYKGIWNYLSVHGI